MTRLEPLGLPQRFLDPGSKVRIGPGPQLRVGHRYLDRQIEVELAVQPHVPPCVGELGEGVLTITNRGGQLRQYEVSAARPGVAYSDRIAPS